MWCQGCAWVIERRLARLPGVEDVGVDHGGALLWVAGDPGVIRIESLGAELRKLGYQLLPLDGAADARGRLESESRRLAGRLLVAALFGMWTMLASLVIYAGAMPEPRYEYVLAWISGAFSLPVVVHAGFPFYLAAWRGLKGGHAGMDLLVTLGVASAMAVSVWLLLQGVSDVYFDTAVMLVLLLLAGRWVEILARYRGLRALESLVPERDVVRCVRDGEICELPPADVAVGDCIEVATGERLPLDGRLLDDSARLDLSPLTGESRPVVVTRGESLAAASRNLGEALRLVVTAPLGECRMDDLYRDMQRQRATKGELRRAADRFAAWLSPLALVLALATLWMSLLVGLEVEDALVRALSVLVVACPCAVGLAVPLASLAGSARALACGVAFRDTRALEIAGQARAVAFDKTGTLTLGDLKVCASHTVQGVCEDELVTLAALAGERSEHPLDLAIRRHAEGRDALPWEAPCRFEEHPGKGRVVWCQGAGWEAQRCLQVGSRDWLQSCGVLMTDEPTQWPLASRVDVARDGQWLGCLWLQDTPHPSAAGLINELRQSGRDVALISGDRAPLLMQLATQLGLPGNCCFAGRTPEQKQQLVAALPRPSVFVGDGINDAPALAVASVGIAPLGASQAARDAAGVHLLRSGPGGVHEALEIARLTRRTMRQNLFFSAIYNMLALGLVVWIPVPPLAAILAMLASSLSVIANAARLTLPSTAADGHAER
ncbi:heavy metal translocating P-type ATPase [Halomonas urumqiensis]|uniref:Heavy metal translocating P-type ATPase n=2 Tax=Halomonas urumqiensis TaxID=1684789 RepID=A0A2N7UFZ3_9GAMM|nr:heavy metal translocating P-type ATPase [Halomonas urumqiensis]PTB04342.1 cation-transporting P-type ATPase [Halomonas urumqiensis]